MTKLKLFAGWTGVVLALSTLGGIYVLARDDKKPAPAKPADTPPVPKEFAFLDPKATLFPDLTASASPDQVPWLLGVNKLPQKPTNPEYQVLVAQLEELRKALGEYVKSIQGGIWDVNTLDELFLINSRMMTVLNQLVLIDPSFRPTVRAWHKEYVRFFKWIEELLAVRLEHGNIRPRDYSLARAARLQQEWMLYKISQNPAAGK